MGAQRLKVSLGWLRHPSPMPGYCRDGEATENAHPFSTPFSRDQSLKFSMEWYYHR